MDDEDISIEADDALNDEIEYESSPGYLDDESWLQIKRNDPNLTTTEVSWSDGDFGFLGNTVDWEHEGYYLGTNEKLKAITISFIDENEEYHNHGRKRLFHFCQGLERNKSIKYLIVRSCRFSIGGIFKYLQSYFRNNSNLRSIEIKDCDMSDECVASLESVLSGNEEGKSSLHQVNICRNRVSDEGSLVKIISALKVHHGIKKLNLDSNEFENGCFGAIGSAALGNLLQNPACNIRALSLRSCGINDEGISTLPRMLLGNNLLKKLCISYNRSITSTGWKALSADLRSLNSSLKVLDLEGNQIDDHLAADLASSLGHRATLRVLNLSMIHLTPVGWRAFSSLSSLKVLIINQTNIDDEGLTAIGDMLNQSPNLLHLDLDDNGKITAPKWRDFFSELVTSKSPLKKLHLAMNKIDDTGLAALANVLDNKRTLKTISLSNVDGTSPNGWIVFLNQLHDMNSAIECIDLHGNHLILDEGAVVLSNILQSPDFVLRELILTHIAFSNEDMTAIANALVFNHSLRVLRLEENLLESDESDSDESDSDESTIAPGWAALSNALCDTSSINATYSSNHSLQEVFDGDGGPEDIPYLLKLNKNNTKSEAARQKILQYHILYDGINIEEFVSMDLRTIPTAISWIGRDDDGFSVLYRLLQSMPSLVDSKKEEKALRLKRKRDS